MMIYYSVSFKSLVSFVSLAAVANHCSRRLLIYQVRTCEPVHTATFEIQLMMIF